jgi:hypothetical protein
MLLAVAAGLLLAQSPPTTTKTLHIANDGSIETQDDPVVMHNGETVTWVRRDTSQITWYVKFADNPCAEKADFGHDRTKVCTISAPNCSKTDTSGCKRYKYSSATSSSGTMHDPVVVVDPASN